MCRRARATSRTKTRWLTGRRGCLQWCYYHGGYASRRRLTWWTHVGGDWLTLATLRQEYMNVAKRMHLDKVLAAGAGLGPTYGEIVKHLPQLCSWLCDLVYEDGTAKGVVRLQLQRRADRIECVLKSEDSGLCLTACHESLTDAILTLELLLGHDDCPWQLDPFPLGGRGKGRKK